ncbi:MAG: zinc ribbon domain-containing protein [Nannocystaceae bacterium]|nr:zinc ribbon domain-containing protein [Nannocystaceae bacterium]
MIIFGTRTTNPTAGQGLFNCPRCGPQKPYTHKKQKRWFTLYFIPVIPLGTAGEYLECNACAGTFDMDALHHDPAAERAEMFDRLRRLSVLAMLFANRYQPDNVTALRTALQEITQDFIAEEVIHQDVQFAQQAQAQLEPTFQSQTQDFSADGKSLLIRLILSTLAPTRHIETQDHQTLHRVGAAMAVPPDVIEQAIAAHVAGQ